jgi:hypothetical protein
VLKGRRDDTFAGGQKVKVEFRHPFFASKRFSLSSSHTINANVIVFFAD